MKKITLLCMVALAATVSSCDKRPDVSGRWVGEPTRVQVSGTATATSTTTIDFAADGTVNFTSMVDFTEPMAERVAIDAPYGISVAATASISGSWQFVEHEDDEIAIIFDDSTLRVDIDPEAVEFTRNVITDAQEPQVDSLKPALADTYRRMLTPAMRAEFATYSRLEDVKTKAPFLRFETKDLQHRMDVDRTFRAVAQ